MSDEVETALVTGACGFVGERMVELLDDRGFEVVASDLPQAYDGGFDDVEFRAADLTSDGDVREAVDGVDVVFHTAAVFSYSSLVPWRRFHEVNVEGTRRLCRAAATEDADVVLWSTVGVYGSADEDELPITEEHRRRGRSKYDESKIQQEDEAMMRHGEDDIGLKILRPAPIYGPGNTYGTSQLWRMVDGGFLRFYPERADLKLPLVHVDDVAAAALHLYREGEDGEAYNVVDDQKYTAGDVLRFVGELTDTGVYGLPVGQTAVEGLRGLRHVAPLVEKAYAVLEREPPIEADSFEYLDGNYWITNEKLRDTGYELRHPSYEEGLRETIDWMKDEGTLSV